MSYLLASAARATVGARSGQEDAYSVWPAEGQLKPSGESGLLAVLADGMGGHRGGAIAGQTACSTFTQAFASTPMPLGERLDMALHASNDALAQAVAHNGSLKGMGCTLIGAWFDDTGIRWTSVGDSLLLLYRFPDVIRLNEDHSLGSYLDEQARRNEITYEEARGNRHRNALRSALTGGKIDLIDLRGQALDLMAGDWILLASDGIQSLDGDELADIMYRYRESTPQEMSEALIAAVEAKAVPEQDNTTVVAVRVDGASDTVMQRPGGDAQDEQKTLRTRRIGVVSNRKTVPGARKPAQPPAQRSTFETLLVKGPMALLLAAGAVFVLAAAIYLYKASRGLDSVTDTPARAIESTKQRGPATAPPSADSIPEKRSAPSGPPSPLDPPPGPKAVQPPDPPKANPNADPGQPPGAQTAPTPPAPVPAKPPAKSAPKDSSPRAAPNGRRTAPAPSREDPDSTSEPSAPGLQPAEPAPGAEPQRPQPQQGGSPPTRTTPRKLERVLVLPHDEDLAEKPNLRRLLKSLEQ